MLAHLPQKLHQDSGVLIHAQYAGIVRAQNVAGFNNAHLEATERN